MRRLSVSFLLNKSITIDDTVWWCKLSARCLSISVSFNNNDDDDDLDYCWFKTRSTTQFGWQMKLGSFFVSCEVEISDTFYGAVSNGCIVVAKAKVTDGFFVFNKTISITVDDEFDRFWFRLNTRSIVSFGWLIKLGRCLVVALFLFLTGGALSALLLERMETLTAWPSVLLSLLFSGLLLWILLLLRSTLLNCYCVQKNRMLRHHGRNFDWLWW